MDVDVDSEAGEVKISPNPPFLVPMMRMMGKRIRSIICMSF